MQEIIIFSIVELSFTLDVRDNLHERSLTLFLKMFSFYRFRILKKKKLNKNTYSQRHDVHNACVLKLHDQNDKGERM